ncbi:hypothetical protein [Enterococcus phage vB_Efs19_KEN07]
MKNGCCATKRLRIVWGLNAKPPKSFLFTHRNYFYVIMYITRLSFNHVDLGKFVIPFG